MKKFKKFLLEMIGSGLVGLGFGVLFALFW